MKLDYKKRDVSSDFENFLLSTKNTQGNLFSEKKFFLFPVAEKESLNDCLLGQFDKKEGKQTISLQRYWPVWKTEDFLILNFS